MAFFSVIEEAKFEPKRVGAIIEKKVSEQEKQIRKLEAMSGEEWTRLAIRSGSIFTVGGSVGKHLAIKARKQRIEHLKQIQERVNYYVELSKKAERSPFWGGVLETTIRQSFKGQLRRGRKTITQLIEKAKEKPKAKPKRKLYPKGTYVYLPPESSGSKPYRVVSDEGGLVHLSQWSKAMGRDEYLEVPRHMIRGIVPIPKAKPKKRRRARKVKGKAQKSILSFSDSVWKVRSPRRRRR